MIKHKILVQKIEWIDKESLEAEIFFELNQKRLWAFCYPCPFNEGEIKEVSFSIIEEEINESIFWELNKKKEKTILKSNDKTRYYCFGQIIASQPMLIDCGIITIPLEYMINDSRVIGEYVYFVISRLDININ